VSRVKKNTRAGSMGKKGEKASQGHAGIHHGKGMGTLTWEVLDRAQPFFHGGEKEKNVLTNMLPHEKRPKRN